MSATLACGERRLGLGVVVQMDTMEFPADVVRATAMEGRPVRVSWAPCAADGGQCCRDARRAWS